MEFEKLQLKFSYHLENFCRNRFFSKHKKHQLLNSQSIYKDIQLAERAKLEGNKLFGSLSDSESSAHYETLHLYNKSIAFAPSDSEELAAAYLNKSALLKRMRRYSECIEEVDKGLKITQSIPLKIKLLCRKAECLTALGSSENRSCLEKSKFLLSRLDNREDKMRKVLKSLVKKTKGIVDDDQLDTPKQNKRKMEATEQVVEAEKRTIWSSVQVNVSAKYGRHLVAKRDFEPGEILYVEKPYRSYLDGRRVYQYCSHCFDYLWTIVPCNACPWRAFCSDKCKTDAWNEYHELDCHILCCMKREKKPGEPNFSLPFVLVTILVCALQEAGSMSQLQAELESIDSHKDPCNRGFSSNGEFDSYKSLHSLPVHKLDDKDFDYCMWGVALALRGILRFSQVFETPHDFEDVKKLRKNKTALFVTSFLFRASCASHDKCFHTHLFEPSKQIIDSCDKSIENFDNPTEGLGDRDEDFLNVTLALASSLITIGCVPNVDKCITFANKVVFYVLRPIKAGSQIIYGGKMDSSFYELATKSSRQSAHQKFYNCPCECEACINDWSEILPTMTGVFKVPLPLRRSEDECLIEMEAIMDEWIANAHKQNYPNFKQISKTRDVMVKAWKCIPMPSLAIIYIISSARILFQSFYDPSEVSTKHIAIQFKKRLALLPRLDMKEIRKNIHYD